MPRISGQSRPDGERRRLRIGVIAGSGPEAGVDLWSKILVANRQMLGERFRGDIDSPPVVIFSEPVLGLSMDLAKNDAVVWACLERTVRAMVPHVDVFTIACNTLHYYAERIEELRGDAVFLDVAGVVRSHIEAHASGSVALMGSASVAALDAWSPYLALHREVSFETPPDLQELHNLIHEIKVLGQDSEDIRRRFAGIVSRLESPIVFLACTELPLVRATVPNKTLVDINMLLAEQLVRYSLGEDSFDRAKPIALKA
jgi:aspartate racemase